MMILGGFMIGLLGSLHCLGMCGPIAFALPVRTTNSTLKAFKYLSYNLGRVFTYSLLGLIIGTLGKGFALAGLQQTLSIVTGILVIASVLIINNPIKKFFLTQVMHSVKEKLKTAFRFYLKSNSSFALFVLGVLNGLLPCGLVYTAIVGALATGSAVSGAMFMAAFGLGTAPLMMAVSFTGNFAGIKLKKFFRKTTPILACILGLILILRGMNLNIPFISPSISKGEVHKCH